LSPAATGARQGVAAAAVRPVSSITHSALSSLLGRCSGEGKPVKVEYTLTPEDYAAVMHQRVQNSPRKPRWAQYVGMAAICRFLLSQGAMRVAQGLPWPAVVGVSVLLAGLFFVLFRFLQPLIFKLLMAGVLRRAHIPAARMRLEVRPEGLAVTTGPT